MSKKKPLLIVVNLANEKETELALSKINSQSFGYYKSPQNEENKGSMVDYDADIHDCQEDMVKKKFLFKCGDDLR